MRQRYRHFTRSELVLGQYGLLSTTAHLPKSCSCLFLATVPGIPHRQTSPTALYERGLLLELFLGVFFRNTFNIIRMYLKKYIPKTIHVIHDKMGIQFNRFVDGQRICWFAGQFGVQINAMLDAMQWLYVSWLLSGYRLWMYASVIRDEASHLRQYIWIIVANPWLYIETLNSSWFLGVGTFNWFP